MKEEAKCWICGRTGEEVRASLDRQTDREIEVDEMIARVNDSRHEFERTSKMWSGNVPEQFRNMDFAFVLKNPKQFKAAKFMDALTRAKKSLVDSLVDAADRVREGNDARLGIVSVSRSDGKQLELMTRELDEFEKRSGRLLGLNLPDRSAEAGRPMGFEGLKLREGIRYLTEVGLLYYTIQSGLLRYQKEKAKGERPSYGVALVKVTAHPAGVPLCNVCELLIGKEQPT